MSKEFKIIIPLSNCFVFIKFNEQIRGRSGVVKGRNISYFNDVYNTASIHAVNVRAHYDDKTDPCVTYCFRNCPPPPNKQQTNKKQVISTPSSTYYRHYIVKRIHNGQI